MKPPCLQPSPSAGVIEPACMSVDGKLDREVFRIRSSPVEYSWFGHTPLTFTDLAFSKSNIVPNFVNKTITII